MTERREDPEQIGDSPANSRVDIGRRRLGQAALGGGALALALRAGSVRASTCLAPSATASVNPSSQHDTLLCSGRSPGAWMSTWDNYVEKDGQLTGLAQDEGWTTPWPGNWSGTDLFTTMFTRDPFAVADPNATLHDVLSVDASGSGGGDRANVSAYFVATFLNIAAGFVPPEVLTEAGLRDMYERFVDNGGYFDPYPGGMSWGPYEVKLYLSTTWGESDTETVRAMLR